MAGKIPGFDSYFRDLTPNNNKRNSWFKEFWEEEFECSYEHDSNRPSCQSFGQNR